jgi:hypothetical protein
MCVQGYYEEQKREQLQGGVLQRLQAEHQQAQQTQSGDAGHLDGLHNPNELEDSSSMSESQVLGGNRQPQHEHSQDFTTAASTPRQWQAGAHQNEGQPNIASPYNRTRSQSRTAVLSRARSTAAHVRVPLDALTSEMTTLNSPSDQHWTTDADELV